LSKLTSRKKGETGSYIVEGQKKGETKCSAESKEGGSGRRKKRLDLREGGGEQNLPKRVKRRRLLTEGNPRSTGRRTALREKRRSQI